MVAVRTRIRVATNNRVIKAVLDGPVSEDVENRAENVRTRIAKDAPRGRPRYGPRGLWRGDQDPPGRTRLTNPQSYIISNSSSEAGPTWTSTVELNKATAPHGIYVIFGTTKIQRQARNQSGQFTSRLITSTGIRPRQSNTRGMLVFPRYGGPGLMRKASVAGQKKNDYMGKAIRAAR